MEFSTFVKSIGFGQYLGDFHAANVGDLESLQFLVKRQNLLCKVVELEGHRAKLVEKMRAYEEGNLNFSQETEDLEHTQNIIPSSQPLVCVIPHASDLQEDSLIITDDPESLSSDERPPKRAKSSNVLLKFLEESAEGKYLIQLSQNKCLDNKSRLRLANIIINREYGADTNTVISSARFQELAKEICEAFPDELPETYFVPSYTPRGGKTVLAKGKLYDKYTSLNKDLRDTDLRKLRPGQVYTDLAPLPILSVNNPESVRASLKFLETNLNPWNAVVSHWENTSTHRLNVLYSENTGQGTVEEYFKQYPCLTLENGYTLLEHDFGVRHPDSNMRIHSHWAVFSNKVKAELTKKGFAIDGDVDLLQKFVHLFSVVTVKTSKKPWRANKSDIVKGFFHVIPRDRDFYVELAEISEQAKKKGITVQPFPLLVGDSTKDICTPYLVIDGKPIKVDNPLRALEAAFKSFFALNCKYPAQSERLWIVLQKTLFNLHVPYDRINPIANLPEVKRLVKCLEC